MQLQLHDRMHNEPGRTDYDNRVVGESEDKVWRGQYLSSRRGICLERKRKGKIMARTQIETQRRTCGYRERRRN